jgi:hypothetical protein
MVADVVGIHTPQALLHDHLTQSNTAQNPSTLRGGWGFLYVCQLSCQLALPYPDKE